MKMLYQNLESAKTDTWDDNTSHCLYKYNLMTRYLMVFVGLF